jgi:hypothetical protein
MTGDILLMECDDPLNPQWKRVALFNATGRGYLLQPLIEAPVILTLKEWFADGIAAIAEDPENGGLVLNRIPPGSDEFINLVEDRLGARFRLVR